jgi:glycosyltransferase involved in cell wall biosynthesis
VNPVPRLSIGLPVYNGEKYIAESLDALLGQTYSDFELIISDNASTDHTADICRAYQRLDSRIRYIRQPSNIGSAGNHNFVFRESRGELFKWAAADDLYARELLARCVAVLDEYPRVVLAHSWTAAVDDAGKVTQALEYPLATDSPDAAERFRSMLFGSGEDDNGLIRADDQYGVIRTAVLRKVAPQNSFYHSDRVLMTEIVLHGPFEQIAEWLYFRRDHADRPQHSSPTVRAWCANLDPRRANRLAHPNARLIGEFLWGYVAAIRRAPLSPADRRACYAHFAHWVAGRTLPAANRAVHGGMLSGGAVTIPHPAIPISVEAVVAGQERSGRERAD